ncbi:MAG: fibrillarin-like rRNA/tRNA 2'-O-methyltransferase [Candidatus Thermoplasmatota archaeon]|nr:fibrillarin-like rRNA/tRNA 2'-O-methyltransferase [Candidatus Thermoplasmatota archaeon]
MRFARVGDRIYTLDRMGGIPVYGEKMIEIDGKKFREWIPWRSKLGALLKIGELPFDLDGDILYLGAAQGTTVSHISDMLEQGTIFAVEFSRAPFNKLMKIARQRKNIVPILEDAFHPEKYRSQVPKVDMLYQDVSQKDQLGLFRKNAEMFLRDNGNGIIMVKARSIDVTARPGDVFDEFRKGLVSYGYKVLDVIDMEPFQKDHSAFVVEK